jgi:transcription antitermination protein NusB
MSGPDRAAEPGRPEEPAPLEADARPKRRSRDGRSREDRAAQDDLVRARRAGRRIALAAIFEADFGQRTADAILERHLATEASAEAAGLAREIVGSVVAHRDTIDALITRLAPRYPVMGMARMDRALLRSAISEVLHSPATPARVAIAEWVELARTYSGDPMRRLMNGVLGRISREPRDPEGDTRAGGEPEWPAPTIG